MNQIAITITLDPLKDGIQGTINNSESTAGRFLVVGTNYEHRIISEKEFFTYIAQMEVYSRQLFFGDYMVIYDARKEITVSGEKYLVGSFMLAKTCDSGEVFCKLSGEEVEGVKEQLSGYCTEIIINGERYDALALD